jgi:hypothetical protein
LMSGGGIFSAGNVQQQEDAQARRPHLPHAKNQARG